uniref:Uncharacterized protein n=1 Tax=Glossina pallidipes TaxID=7398 RepID=A0A1A9ZYF9_GLOPL
MDPNVTEPVEPATCKGYLDRPRICIVGKCSKLPTSTSCSPRFMSSSESSSTLKLWVRLARGLTIEMSLDWVVEPSADVTGEVFCITDLVKPVESSLGCIFMTSLCNCSRATGWCVSGDVGGCRGFGDIGVPGGEFVGVSCVL